MPRSDGMSPHGIKTVTAILKAGVSLEADVPMDEDEGDFHATPVWYAYFRGENPALVRFLIAAGADPRSKDPRGRDALDIARARRLPKDVIARLAALKQDMG